jgi:hypothetical protein
MIDEQRKGGQYNIINMFDDKLYNLYQSYIPGCGFQGRYGRYRATFGSTMLYLYYIRPNIQHLVLDISLRDALSNAMVEVKPGGIAVYCLPVYKAGDPLVPMRILTFLCRCEGEMRIWTLVNHTNMTLDNWNLDLPLYQLGESYPMSYVYRSEKPAEARGNNRLASLLFCPRSRDSSS